MTFKEAEKLLEDQPCNSKKERDPKAFAKGIALLDKYTDDWLLEIAAEHDIIYLPSFNEAMPKEEVLQLHDWGFHLESESECWANFS